MTNRTSFHFCSISCSPSATCRCYEWYWHGWQYALQKIKDQTTDYYTTTDYYRCFSLRLRTIRWVVLKGDASSSVFGAGGGDPERRKKVVTVSVLLPYPLTHGGRSKRRRIGAEREFRVEVTEQNTIISGKQQCVIVLTSHLSAAPFSHREPPEHDWSDICRPNRIILDVFLCTCARYSGAPPR